jgi:hypothetical protein
MAVRRMIADADEPLSLHTGQERSFVLFVSGLVNAETGQPTIRTRWNRLAPRRPEQVRSLITGQVLAWR